MRSDMEFWRDVRRQVLTGELSRRAACRKHGLGWHTLKKILSHEEPPGYRQSQPRTKRKLEPFLPIIHQILADDRQAPKKQRHTARRIFERLRDEHGYQGGQTVVKDAVRAWKQSRQEVFLPLSHPPGEAQVDFGEATIRLAGQETKVALFVMTLPYSGAIYHPPGLSPGVHRDLSGRASPGVRVLRGCAEADQLRQLGDRRDRSSLRHPSGS